MLFGGRSFVYTRSKEYRDFQYYAMYASKSDFFDLYNVLRDSIFYSNSCDLRPKLNIKLEPEQQTQAKLQQIMGSVYSREQYSHPSKWHKNDLLLTLMYQLISELSEQEDAKYIRIEKIPFRILFLNDKGDVVKQVPCIEGRSK